MHMAVIGASGRIGGCVVREALMRTHTVTAVLREGSAFDPAEVGESAAGSLTVARADVFEPATLAAAVADAQVVISAIGHAATSGDQSYYVRAAQSLVAAMRARRVDGRHLLVVGGFGGLRTATGGQLADRGGFPQGAAPEILGQRDALTYYRGVTDVRWTYLSPPPSGIRLGERTGSYRSRRDRAFDGDPRPSPISPGDFAMAVLDEAERAQNVSACVSVASTDVG